MHGTTIPRPQSLDDLTEVEAAASVLDYIGYPQQEGDWLIRDFTVTERDAKHDYFRSFGDGGGRFTPAGHYLMLRNVNEDSDVGTMMSNTPNELEDHTAFMENAYGRVLVHGLGLSCVVSGLLANPNIDHIDVVEIDEAIIRMVGPAFDSEDRVTIHHGDCMTYEWPSDASWDFAWHDIWAKISDLNLDSTEAEYGIGYDALLTKFADRVDFQDAWALREALLMQRAGAEADRIGAEWEKRWHDADEEGRWNLLLEWHTQPNPVLAGVGVAETDGDERAAAAAIPTEAMEALVENSPDMKADWRRRVKSSKVKFIVDAPPLMIGLRLLVPGLVEDYLETHGLYVADEGFAAKAVNVIPESED